MQDETWQQILQAFRFELAPKIDEIVGVHTYEGEGGNDEEQTYVAIWGEVEVSIVVKRS